MTVHIARALAMQAARHACTSCEMLWYNMMEKPTLPGMAF